jgi:protocatechuate 3,4-dioxygenase beta subunit
MNIHFLSKHWVISCIGGLLAFCLNGQSQPFPPQLHLSGVVRDMSGNVAPDVLVSFHPGFISLHLFGIKYSETNTDADGRYDLLIKTGSKNIVSSGPLNMTNFLLAQDFRRNLAACEEFQFEEVFTNAPTVRSNAPTLLRTNLVESFRMIQGGFQAMPTNLDLNLEPAGSLSGNVQDAEGNPITNAEVTVCLSDGYYSTSSSILTMTPLEVNQDGIYAMDTLPQGLVYYLYPVSAAGYGAEKQYMKPTETLHGHYVFPAVILQSADLFLGGQVIGPDGIPAPGALVQFFGNGQPEQFQTKTDGNGRFLFRASQGPVSLHVYAGHGSGVVNATAGDTNIVIQLH